MNALQLLQEFALYAPDDKRELAQRVVGDVEELIDAVAYALRTRDEAGALNSTAEHNLCEAMKACEGE